jgi:tripartite-type tricarboxylate transporter receptor subunit TctC
LLATAAAAPLAALASRPAFAAYPDKPVRLIVPFAAGGNADFVGRLVGESMGRTLGHPLVIENRAGAGGSLGADMAAKAAADGYTLFLGSNGPLTVNPFVQAKLGYDPLKDFAPVGLANLAPHCLAVNGDVKAKTIPEFVALTKSTPASIGTSGVGSASHMTLARFGAATGAAITHVPYRGGGNIVPDLLAGTITGTVTELSTVLPQVSGGKVRVLGVAWDTRSPQLPEVPTMIEQGLKDFTAASYVGLLAPTGTPAEVMKVLEAALIKALNDKGLQEKMLISGAVLVPDALMTPQGFGGYIKKEYELAREAAKIAGLTPA